MRLLARIRLRLTYANIVSSLALFLVLSGGTAVALSGANTVFTDDIKNGEVRNADIRTSAVSNAKLGPNSVNGAKVVSNAMKGADIDEGSLDEVPNAALADFATDASRAANATDAENATNATNAVNATSATNATEAVNSDTVDGVHARYFTYTRLAPAGREEMLSLGALRLEVSCGSGANLEVFAKTTTSGSYIRSSNEADGSFNIGDEVEVQNAGDGTSVLAYREGGSSGNDVNRWDAVTVTLAYDESPNSCDVAGTAIGR